jgi:flagellum-specific peptidoglycan hydrolase FlgJ
MLRKCLFIVITAIFCIQSVKAGTVKKYIDQYSTLVKSLSEEFGIPSSVITAISIVESGAGKSRSAVLLNNHFGVIGKNNLRRTKGIKTKFKQYDSAEDSFREFCKMLTRRKYYAKLKGNNDYKLWVTAMSKAGYSTQPEVWKKMILGAIKKYKLDVATNLPAENELP